MVFSIDQFFFTGAKKLDPIGIRTTDLPIHGHQHYPLLYESLNFPMLQPILY